MFCYWMSANLLIQHSSQLLDSKATNIQHITKHRQISLLQIPPFSQSWTTLHPSLPWLHYNQYHACLLFSCRYNTDAVTERDCIQCSDWRVCVAERLRQVFQRRSKELIVVEWLRRRRRRLWQREGDCPGGCRHRSAAVRQRDANNSDQQHFIHRATHACCRLAARTLVAFRQEDFTDTPLAADGVPTEPRERTDPCTLPVSEDCLSDDLTTAGRFGVRITLLWLSELGWNSWLWQYIPKYSNCY